MNTFKLSKPVKALLVTALILSVAAPVAMADLKATWVPDADKILINAQIVTVDDSVIDLIKAKEYVVKKEAANYPIIDNGAIAIKDGKIIAVTSSADIAKYKGAGTEVVDLGGKVVIPGLMDSHIHATGLGWDLTYGFELTYALTKEEIVEAIRQNILKHGWGAGDWVRGSRWDETKYPEMITRWDIDKVTTGGQYVRLGRIFLGAIVNTNVFNAMGIYDQDPSTWPNWWLENPPEWPLEDVVMRAPLYIESLGKEVNVPTGVFIGRNAPQVLTVRPPSRSFEDNIKSIKLSQERLFEWGTVALQEPGGDNLKAYQEAYDRGWLKGRVSVIDNYITKYDPAALKARLQGFRNHDGLGNGHLKVMGQKYSIDGGYTTRGAWMSHPFEDWEDIEGVPNYGNPGISDFDELYEMCRIAAENGWSNHIHYCGDAGGRLAMDVYKKLYAEMKAGAFSPYDGRVAALPEGEELDIRWSIIHAYSPLEPDTRFIDDAADLGVVIAGQPIFSYSEIQSWIKNVGIERVARSTPVRSYLESGCMFTASTDYGSALPNPWVNIYAMLTRKCQVTGNTYGGGEPGYKDETVGIADALATMTILGAYAVYDEGWRGSIEVGKAADLVVLDLPDIFALDRNPELCFEMDKRVMMTMVDGEAVYKGVEGLTLSGGKTTLQKGKNMAITPLFTPADATNQAIIWTTSNPKVATVEDGVIKGVAAGTVTINATTVDGEIVRKLVVRIM